MPSPLSKKARRSRGLSRSRAILSLLAGLSVAIIVGHFEPEAIAKAAGNSTAVMLMTSVIFWTFRGERWFWPYIVIASIAHAVLIAKAPWPGPPPPHHKDPFILIFIADITVTIALGYLTAKLTKAPSAEPLNK